MMMTEESQEIGNKRIQRRLWDLLPVIRSHVYHPEFVDSYSLKSVLPALVPAMSYQGMEVGDGKTAGLAWESLLRDSMEETGRERIRTALLKYCCQDTLGMIRLIEVIERNA
jgi:hypothetical protein